MDESDSSVHEYLPIVHQIKRIFERNFYKLICMKSSIIWQNFCVESNLVLKFFPHAIIFGELLVVHTTFVSKDLQYVVRFVRVKSMVEKPCLLGCKPFSELVISAISQSAYEMRNFVVCQSLIKFFHWHFIEIASLIQIFVQDIIVSFYIQLMLPRVLVYLFGHIIL